MPQSLSALYAHLVFSTKNREPFLADAVLRGEMHAFLGGASKTLGAAPLIVGGVEDHVHMLARQNGNMKVVDWIKELKRTSSIWIKEREPSLRRFYWQRGYGAFSVGVSEIDRVRNYIERQEEHHRTMDFKTECRALLREHKIEWDERYVWD